MNTETALPESKTRSVVMWLFDPFHYAAGGTALLAGLGVIVTSALIAITAQVHFDGTLDFHTGADAPWWVYFAEGLVAWLSAALFFLLAGKLLSKSRVRTIDVLGTQALARFPYVLFALWHFPRPVREANLGVVETLMKSVSNPGANPFAGVLAGDLILFGITAILAILMLVWLIALMYRAFAVTCNLSGLRAVAGFIPALILAEIFSKAILFVLYSATSAT
ncbi:MAG: hypothetical protein R6V12_18390 [Candidatus Hydrogenedentota bacterium]